MKLYYKAGACSLAPHIILRESGRDFTMESVDQMQKKLEKGDDYLAIAPKGQIPALPLDGNNLETEAVVMMQYLADAGQDRKLLEERKSTGLK